MSPEPKKPGRGRPKTFDREYTLGVAMRLYWREGIDGVSLNEICERANVSKPSLYREFGNDDGLMRAVLVRYRNEMLEPLFELLARDAPFHETLHALIALVTEEDAEAPKGCLFVKMRASRLRVGAETRKEIDRIQNQLLRLYRDWVARSRQKGDFRADLDPKFAAAYINSQLGNAKSQAARGEKAKNIRSMLELAFSVFDQP